MGGVDVEKAEFIRTGGIIGDGGINRITGIAQANEVHTFDDAAVRDVKAGDDAGFEHLGVLSEDMFGAAVVQVSLTAR
ncbi:hypothetical protein GCM10007927_08460 [Sulfitobacter pacificus]|uniref:Uncharacterized protein n=1 Tax=Sulfitobacter pacificus TaxID=1499314 RepID=A0ABQ5VG42_9RHOB|nr:hypothetical protein GCM10007927_08460 [Sulfitobacter pacificus]